MTRHDPLLCLALMSAPGYGGIRKAATLDDLVRASGYSQGYVASEMRVAVDQRVAIRTGRRTLEAQWIGTSTLDGMLERGELGDPEGVDLSRIARCAECGGYLDAPDIHHGKRGSCFVGDPWVCEECGTRLAAPVVRCERHDPPGRAVRLSESRFDAPTPRPIMGVGA